MVLLLVLVLLVFLAFGGMPAWGYHHYGWTPSGLLVVLVVVVLVVLLFRRF